MASVFTRRRGRFEKVHSDLVRRAGDCRLTCTRSRCRACALVRPLGKTNVVLRVSGFDFFVRQVSFANRFDKGPVFSDGTELESGRTELERLYRYTRDPDR